MAANEHEACQENDTNDKREYSADEVGHTALESSIHKEAHSKRRSETREQHRRFCQKCDDISIAESLINPIMPPVFVPDHEFNDL